MFHAASQNRSRRKKMMKTDSAITPPPKTVIFINERFTTARHEKDAKKESFIYFVEYYRVCRTLLNDDVGVAVFPDTARRAGFKTGDSVYITKNENTYLYMFDARIYR